MKKAIYVLIMYSLIIIYEICFSSKLLNISFLLCIICINLVALVKCKDIVLNKRIIMFSIIILLIFAYVKYVNNMFENSLKEYVNINNTIYVGKILNYEKKTYSYNVYKFKIININDKNVKIPIYLYTKNQYNYGEEIVANLKLELPLQNKNEGSFNNKLFLFSKGVHGIGYLEKEIDVNEAKPNIFSIIDSFKQIITNKILTKYDETSSSILISMLLGDNKYVTSDIKDIFSASSLSHILSTSGTHLIYLITIIGYIMYKLNLKLKYKNILLISFVVGYIILTNFKVSIMRAGVMYIFYLMYLKKQDKIHKKVNKITIILSILILLLIYNPFNLFNISAILSFSSVIGIIFFSKKIKYKLKYNLNKQNSPRLNKIINMISMTLAVQITLIPIISIYFNKIYFLSIFSNILAIPISNISLLFGVIFSLLPNLPIISNILVILNTAMIQLLVLIADYFSKLPLSNITIFPFNIYEIVIYYFAIYTIFISNKYTYIIKYKIQIVYKFFRNIIIHKLYKKTVILIVIYLVITIFLVVYNNRLKLEINFIDVGQGDSTLIRCCGKTILIDGGGNETNSFDIGEKVLLPYLLHERINKIDYVIISHFDNDHIKGLIPVINSIKVDKIIYGKNTFKTEEYITFINKIGSNIKKLCEVKEYDRINISKNVFIDILAPIENISITESISNNSSLVCKLTYINQKILFTGDIEEETENNLLEKDIEASIIKIGHHGSNSSTNESFLNKVNPETAIICVGKNSFGHPSNEVINILTKKNIDIYRTDINGMITIKIGLKGNVKIDKMIK